MVSIQDRPLVRSPRTMPETATPTVLSDGGTPPIQSAADAETMPRARVARLVESSEALVTAAGRARVPTEHGTFEAAAYVDRAGLEQMAYLSTVATDDAPLVRVHSECLTGDSLGSLRCDCGSQLRQALERIGTQGGVLLYLRGHEGRGIGLGPKMQAYALQDDGLDTVDANEALGHPADARTYDVAAAMLRDLGIERIRLLSNNPAKALALAGLGIDVVEQVPLHGEVTEQNRRYLATKRERMAHTFSPVDDTAS